MTKNYQNKILSHDFFQKLGGLFVVVQNFLASQELADDIDALNKKFNLPAGLLSAMAGDLITGGLVLSELSAVLKDCLGSDFGNLQEIEINFLGVIFLPIDEYLDIDVKGQLVKLGGRLADFVVYVEKFRNMLDSQQQAVADEAVEEYLAEATSGENRQAVVDLFTNDLVDILKSKSDDLKEQLNVNLFALFDQEESLIQELSNVLLANQQELTKPAPFTIANWLKDFIQQAGVEMFDNLVLSNFITNSPNAKILDSNERELLRQLLLTYRNLKFFPESMGDLPAEQWQIIPYRREEELAKTVARPIAEAPSSPPAKTPTFQSGPAPGFHFHPEDEAEAAKFKSSPAVMAHQMNWPELVEELIKQANLNLGDEVLIKRLKNVILLNLRDIRDALETKDALTRSIKVGGLGLAEDKAEEILALIKNKGQKLPEKFKELADKRAQAEKEAVLVAEQKKLADWQRRQRELVEHARASAEITKQKLAACLPVRQAKLDVSRELPPPPPALFKQPAKRPVSQPIRPIASPVRKEIPARPPQPIVSPKPRLQDVRAMPKLVGPLEELQNLNLVDFRRLSNNPMAAADKVKEQIDLLERDSFAKRLAGIKAWRNSGLYRLYLDIGRQSILAGRLVKDIIAERQTASQQTLNEAEFEAIMDLNKSLRF